MYYSRYIEQEVRFVADHFKVVLLVGARQVGKSTLLKNMFPAIPCITFNPVDDVHNVRKDPGFFLQQFTGPVIFDEVQFAPELLAYIKLKVDESPSMGQYFLTGSQNLSLLKTVAESMAGRVAIIELKPMIPYELKQAFTFSDQGIVPKHWLEHYLDDPLTLRQKCTKPLETGPLIHTLWRGGYPGLITLPDTAVARYFDGYFQTYVDRDIRTLAAIDELRRFEDFVSILAVLTAQEINYSQLGREIDMNGKTAQRWLQFLLATYMWRDVPPYLGNLIKRVSRKRKGYFIDTGLACKLMHIFAPEQLLSHPASGALFETHVSNMIYAILQALPFGAGFYHWRSNGGAEVDIVLHRGTVLYPIEVKMKSYVSKNDIRGIKAFQDTYRGTIRGMTVALGIVVYAGTDCYFVDETVLAMPWNMMCKA